jgi:hypothetical protein
MSAFVAVASFAGEWSEKGTDLRILKSKLPTALPSSWCQAQFGARVTVLSVRRID